MTNYIKIFFFYILLLIFGIFISCKQELSKDFLVNGKLKNVKGSYFIAARELHDSLVIDTICIDKKGNFTIKGSIDTLTIMSLYFNDNNKYTYIFVDKNSNVNINGDVLYADLLDISGGSINDELNIFKKKHKKLLKRRIDIMSALEDSIYINNQVDTPYEKTLRTDLNNINFELSTIAGEYIKTNPDKLSSVMLINAFYKTESTIPRLDECLGMLRGPAARFPITRELAQYSERVKKSAEGIICPSFSRKNTYGQIFNISSLRGKYVLLSFVSSTCEMCEEQRQPQIDLYNKFTEENINIEFVTVVINTEEKPLSQQISKSLKWTILTENGGWSSELLEKFNISAIPFHMLIGPDGTILHRDISLFSVEERMHDVPNRIKLKDIKRKLRKH